MVKRRLKIVNKSWRRQDILDAIQKILNRDFDWLDVIEMDWKPWYYRCRIGKIRIIFFEKDWDFYIDKVWYRWDVYK